MFRFPQTSEKVDSSSSILGKSLAMTLCWLTLSACSRTSFLESRLEAEREARIEQQEQLMQEAPDWYTTPPGNREDVLYGSGTYASTNWDMAERTATNLALGKVCIALKGQINETSRVHQRDVDGFARESAETVISNACRDVPISGYSLEQKHHYTDANGRVRVFVLVAYPVRTAEESMPWPPMEDPQPTGTGIVHAVAH